MAQGTEHTCPSCGAANPSSRRFCGQCGTTLDLACVGCGFVNDPGDRYCGGCGEGLGGPVPATGATGRDGLGDGDRRWVTAFFVDLVDSSNLATSLDPEDMRDVLRTYQGAVGEVIDGLDGTVARVQGDGVFAYFGWPVAHGDDARRAVRAGLDVVGRVAALRPSTAAPFGGDLEARVGIHSGLTVVADMGTEGHPEPDDLVGLTPTLAARLQGAADPGQILLSGDTARQVEGWFDLEDRGRLTLKGIDGPLQVWRALGATTARSRVEARYGSDLPPLVGRAAELDWLEQRAAESATGRAVVSVLLGDAGAGKSRLVRAFLDRHDEPTVVLSCRETHRATALHPLRAVDPTVPGLAEEVAGRAAEDSRSTWLARLASTLADAAPVVVVEDVHWADPTTLDLVAALGRLDRAMLLLLTARSEHDLDLRPLPASHVWALDDLGRTEVEALARQVAADRALPDDVLREIVIRGAGNPLFVEELTESCLDAGGDVPAGLQELLTARLDRLGPARQVAQVAAVIGTRFDADTLDALLPDASSDGLDRLVDERIVEPRSTTDGRMVFEFRHALLHQTAYESVLHRERRSLHGRLADRLLERDDPTVPPEAVARHLQAARRPDAIDHWARAARRAMRASHWGEATQHLEAAIDLLDLLEDAGDRDTCELDLRIQHTVATGMTGQTPLTEQRDNAARFLVLARQLGATQEQVYAGLLLAISEQSLGEFDRALRRVAEVVEVAGATGDVWFQGVARVVRDAMSVWLGADVANVDALEATLADLGFGLDKAVDVAGVPAPTVNGWVGGLSLSGLVHVLRDETEAAETRWVTCQALAESAQEPGSLAMYLVTRAMGEAARGDVGGAAAAAGRARSIAVEAEHTQWLGWSMILAGWAEAHDDPRAGLQTLEGGIERLDADARHLRPYFGALHAEALLDLDPARARHVLEEATVIMEMTGERLFEPELHRVRAAVATVEGRVEDAAQARAAALASAERQGLTYLTGRGVPLPRR